MLVLDLENIKMCGLNNKYISRRFILSKEYRAFKKLILKNCKKIKLKPPYFITMDFSMYKDIDSTAKCILDALEDAEVITNDRYVTRLHIYKDSIKRGYPESLRVWVEEL